MKAVVDGFEGNKARLEAIGSQKTVVVSRSELQRNAGEGSVVDDAGGSWELDIEETARRRKRAAALVSELLK